MSCLGVPAGGRKALLPTQRSGAPFLPGHRGWGGLSAKGTPGLPVERKEWVGVTKGGPLGLPSSPASLTYVHSDVFPGQRWDQRLAGAPARCLPAQCGLGGQRAWRDQPPAPWGQQLQPGSPPEVSVCAGICRERAWSLCAPHASVCTDPTLAPASPLTILKWADARSNRVRFQRPHLERK